MTDEEIKKKKLEKKKSEILCGAAVVCCIFLFVAAGTIKDANIQAKILYAISALYVALMVAVNWKVLWK